ncbi:uncharacterized protein LOC118434416 [Folsomia candida]|uniref:uncharacterized protein LOC118434416 n=1 Tax=Folsomia candida TaxID=158441 RepID=UPI001604BB72|nr:uncharacterized protein LOC118434416 [Folsomia candida]
MARLFLHVTVFVSALVVVSHQSPQRDYSKPQITSFASPFAPPMPGSGMAQFSNPLEKKGPIGNVIANAKGEGGSTSANGYSAIGGNVLSNAVSAPPPGWKP